MRYIVTIIVIEFVSCDIEFWGDWIKKRDFSLWFIVLLVWFFVFIFGIRVRYWKYKIIMVDIKDEYEFGNKEVRFLFIKFLMLIFINYTVWVMRMKIALKVYKVWEVIDFGNKFEEKNNLVIVFLF